jgi:glycosyltransferase involved in cell wall biosynthesis
MNANLPLISVVIPTYNQAQFLVNTIQSALVQTYRNIEIIVVDDGSTDETPKIIQQYGELIQYIRQDNQGLAGARNTGICTAKGQFVALLDSDDLWLPSFLEVMATRIAENPGATVYYCGWRYIDSEGQLLPQSPHTWLVPQREMYQTLLRANFIIPSTVVMNRSRVVEAGLFDPSFRRLQDWEFWLRLLMADHVFIGSDACLVHYRLHAGALSVDHLGGHQAALAIAEKLFGKDDGLPQTWSLDKRRAYGGVYRYHLLTFIQRQNDWQAATNSLQQALQVDPSLAMDLGLFYDLALGSQTAGYRGTGQQLELSKNADQIQRLLADVFYSSGGLRKVRRSAYGTAYFALGLVAYNTKQLHLCREYLTKAVFYRPALCFDFRLLGDLVKSNLNPVLMDKLRQLKGAG